MTSRSFLWVLCAPLLFAALSGLLVASPQERQRYDVAYASVAALKARLPAPAHIAFDAVRVTDAGAACIQYHPANDAAQRREQAVVVGSEVTRPDTPARLERAWERHCLGPSYDVTGAVDRFF